MNIDEIEIKLKEHEERILRLEQNKNSNESINLSSVTNTLGKKIAEKIDGISTANLTMLALFVKPNQSIVRIKQMINDWGWSPDTFFRKNFGTILVNKGLVQKTDKDEENNGIFSLTEKGKLKIEKFMKENNLL